METIKIKLEIKKTKKERTCPVTKKIITANTNYKSFFVDSH